MKTKLLIFLLSCCSGLCAQTDRGVTPIHVPHATISHPQSTYAVVIGISNYQDPAIPDLRFAHRDAEAFANFLRSPAGGSVDSDHLLLLTNEEATAAQIAIALDWLVEETREGNNAVFYFAGHGDLESKRISQPGYLLGWDAPFKVYMAGGAINVRDLQDIVSTLSVQNKARVVVITDACHAGKLSGSDVNGAQLTGQNLARQFANEIKILSCQPNEYSIEGVQWGGGRGAFSFYLLDALYGMADANNDLVVTLQEAGRYLEDHVPAGVAPINQVPVIIGNRLEPLVSVDAGLVADLRANKTNQMAVFFPIENRNLEASILAKVDTSVQEWYRLFKRALEERVFLEPEGACAEAYYQLLMAEPLMASLYSTMTRNYAAALQDGAQQVINTLLKTGLTREVLANAKPQQLYRQYPHYLQRASELLGKDHYLYQPLQARRCFFEAKLQRDIPARRALLHQALQWQPDMPHALVEMMRTFDANQADSVYAYFAKATAQVPSWVNPYIVLSYFYELNTNEPVKAEESILQAGRLDTASVYVWYRKGQFYHTYQKFDQAEYWYRKVISDVGSDVCFPCAHNDLGVLYSSTGRFAEAEQQYKRAIQLDSAYAFAYENLGDDYVNARRYAEAEQQFKKAIGLDSTYAGNYDKLGVLFTSIRRYAEAEKMFQKAIQLDPNLESFYHNLGYLYDKIERYDEAERYFQKSIALDSTYAPSYLSLGYVLAKVRRYAEAEQMFQKANQLDPNDVLFYYTRGYLYDKMERYDEAEQYLQKILRLAPDTWQAKELLGLIYTKTQRYAEAEQALKDALRANPSQAPAWYGLACAQALQNHVVDAYKTLEQAINAGYDNYDRMQTDPYLNALREQKKQWQDLMRKYFPGETKD